MTKPLRLTVGNELYALVDLAALLALWLVVLRRLDLDSDLLLFIAAVLVSEVIGIVIHELGHAGAALALGRPVAEIRIGSGHLLAHFRLRGTVVRLGRNPLGSGKVWLSPSAAKLGKGQGVVFTSAGVVVNILGASLAFAFNGSSPTVLTAFFAVNAWLAISNLVPTDGPPLQPNDGTKLLFRLGILPPVYRSAIAALTPHAPMTTKIEDLALDRWTAGADRAVTAAMDIAARQKAQHIGTEHVIAGVLQDPQSLGARTLIELGFNADALATALAPGAAISIKVRAPRLCGS